MERATDCPACGLLCQTIVLSGNESMAAPIHSVSAEQLTDTQSMRRLGCTIAVLAIAAVVLLFHGWSLSDGMFLDDHYHQAQLAKRGWSPTELLEVTTIGTSCLSDHWWADSDLLWKYSRPVSVVLMKVIHDASGGSVVAQHAVSIMLHLLAAILVYKLALLVTVNRLWSTVGALVFSVYAHSVFTVAWLAAQNAILQTALTLAAVLVYVRSTRLLPTVSTEEAERQEANSRVGLVAFFIVWLLALFSRENAIVLVVLVPILDITFGGLAVFRKRIRLYALLWVVGALFAAWRLVIHYHPMPVVYSGREVAGGYLLWWMAKFFHYICAIIWQSPMTIGPTGRYHPFAEVPGDCLLTIMIIVILGVGYWCSCRRDRGCWVWPVWIVLSILPVIPVMATPHSGYFGGVGFAVAIAVVGGSADAGVRRKAVAAAFLVATGLYFPVYRATWKGICAAERLAPAQIASDTPPIGGEEIYFINLPFVNVYVQTCLEEFWPEEMTNSRCHVLTYAPSLLGVEQDCDLRLLDDNRLAITAGGKPYFSGLLGRFLINAMRKDGCMRAGETVSASGFRVEVEDADERGVYRLVFEFDAPLNSANQRFYVCSANDQVSRLEFETRTMRDPVDEHVDSEPHTRHNLKLVVRPLSDGANGAELQALRRTKQGLLDVRATAGRILGTDMYMTGPEYPGPRCD